MKNCDTCIFSIYTINQLKFSKVKGIDVERFDAKFCRKQMKQVYKNESCNDFKPIEP